MLNRFENNPHFTEPMRPSVLIVEDQSIFQLQYLQALKKSGYFGDIYQAMNGIEAIEMAKQHRPQLILMDIHMPVMNGIEATQLIKIFLPEAKFLMVTCLDSETVIREAFSLGIDGYCLKGLSMSQLVHVCLSVLEGGVWLDPGIAQYVLRYFLHNGCHSGGYTSLVTTEAVDLSRDDMSLLAMISANRSYQEIASSLKLSLERMHHRVRDVVLKMAMPEALSSSFKETA